MAEYRHRKKKNSIKTVFLLLLAAVCLAAFIISAFRVIRILTEDKAADSTYSSIRDLAQADTGTPDETADTAAPEGDSAEEHEAEAVMQRKKSVAIAPLQQEYPQLVAWIAAEGTEMDYPVMQAEDNYFYLGHLYDGTENPNGSIFMDFRNSGVLTDDNTVLYGHNMQSGAMFNVLNEYKSQEFYEDHPTMVITTEEGDYLLELICGTIEDGNYEFVRFNFDDYEDMSAYLGEIRARSTFASGVELGDGDKLVTLCTCTYEQHNARYMLVGRAIELYE